SWKLVAPCRACALAVTRPLALRPHPRQTSRANHTEHARSTVGIDPAIGLHRQTEATSFLLDNPERRPWLVFHPRKQVANDPRAPQRGSCRRTSPQVAGSFFWG